MPKLIDPAKRLKEERKAAKEPSAGELAVQGVVAASVPETRTVKQQGAASTHLTPTLSLEERCKKDFRVFLTMVWRHLLGIDPNAIQLDLAYWLQHGPSRAIIMAFRGFSKSWITGAYALWRLYCDPDEKIMVVSGSLARSVATTTWALQLIFTMPMLEHMIPKANYRQSAMQFDVGSCQNIGQSASFTAFGIGGQLVGFRGSCIIPDDVETQTNSLTVTMREKIRDAVKEFESVLTPGGVIKYLGTPHDVDSLYTYLLRLKDRAGRPVYQARIWPALFPTVEERKAYGPWLAPYITHQIQKLGDICIGHSTMPFRFTDADLEQRRAAIGNSEFRLQFMLDLSGELASKFPLRLSDLTAMDLDDLKGPDHVVWATTNPERDLPVMGMDGDMWYGPGFTDQVNYKPYEQVIAYIDGSGRGADETSMAITGFLFGRIFWLDLFASTDGYGPSTLAAIASRCVRFRVGTLYIEANFGDGMLAALLKPVLMEAWKKANAANKNTPGWTDGSTRVEEIKSGKQGKELRILSVLEPITQQHRLVVSKAVIKWDNESLLRKEGEETRHRYAWGYQYTHLTREKDCLGHDDRLESLAGACSIFAPKLGVDPIGMTLRSREEDTEDEILKLLYEEEDAVNGRVGGGRRPPERAASLLPQSR